MSNINVNQMIIISGPWNRNIYDFPSIEILIIIIIVAIIIRIIVIIMVIIIILVSVIIPVFVTIIIPIFVMIWVMIRIWIMSTNIESIHDFVCVNVFRKMFY